MTTINDIKADLANKTVSELRKIAKTYSEDINLRQKKADLIDEIVDVMAEVDFDNDELVEEEVEVIELGEGDPNVEQNVELKKQALAKAAKAEADDEAREMTEDEILSERIGELRDESDVSGWSATADDVIAKLNAERGSNDWAKADGVDLTTKDSFELRVRVGALGLKLTPDSKSALIERISDPENAEFQAGTRSSSKGKRLTLTEKLAIAESVMSKPVAKAYEAALAEALAEKNASE